MIVSGQKSGGKQSDWHLLNKTLRRKFSVASSRSQGTEKKRVAATPSNVPQLINIIFKNACEVIGADPLQKPGTATQQGAEQEQREYSPQLEI